MQRSQEDLKLAQLTIDKLKVELAYLRRLKYGRSSERMSEQPEHAQLELVGGQIATPAIDETLAEEAKSNVVPMEEARRKRAFRARPNLRDLPEHLPRRTVVHLPEAHQAGCSCNTCGSVLRQIGQDISEMLEYEPGRFHVVRHVRPKLACGCSTIVQAPAPNRPIERVLAGAGLLAHVLVSKYADHTPLYRQAQIYEREGVDLHRSTLTDWVGQAAGLLTPLAHAVVRYVLAAAKIHGDDTPIKALGGKGGKVHTGRLWVYVRDDRPGGSQAPPAVWFQYSADRKGEHPARHLRSFSGILQAAPSPATTRCTTSSGSCRASRRASSRPDAGATHDASCGTSISSKSSSAARWLIKAWCASASCSRSRPASAASRPSSDSVSGTNTPRRCSTSSGSG